MAEIARSGPRLIVYPAPVGDALAQPGGPSLDEEKARRLLEHLRHDWPAMDVILASRSDSESSNQAELTSSGFGHGKGRAWGERPGEVERLEASCPPLPAAQLVAPTVHIAAVAGPTTISAQPGSSARVKRKRKAERNVLDTSLHQPGIGRCFGVLPLPHEHHVRVYHLPDPQHLALKLPPFALPPSATFLPAPPGRLRGKWIIPIHGPSVGCPGVSSGWLATNPDEAQEVRVVIERRLRKAAKAARAARIATAATVIARQPAVSPLEESGRSNSQDHRPPALRAVAPVKSSSAIPVKSSADTSIAASSSPASPQTILWTPPLLKSFHKALHSLAQKSHLGPVSFVLHPSTLPLTARTNGRAPAVGGRDPVCFGDHYRIYVDLAYALNVRELLETLDLRLESSSMDGRDPARARSLAGSRLALVSDVGEVLLVA